jgi:hypothetical protein
MSTVVGDKLGQYLEQHPKEDGKGCRFPARNKAATIGLGTEADDAATTRSFALTIKATAGEARPPRLPC